MGERRRKLGYRFELTVPSPCTLKDEAFNTDPCLEVLWDWANPKIKLSHYPNFLLMSSRARSIFHLNGTTWAEQMEINNYLEWLKKQNNGPFFSAVALAQICEHGARHLTTEEIRMLVLKHMLPGAYFLLCDTSGYDDQLRDNRLTRMREDFMLHGVTYDDELPPPYRGYLGKKAGQLPAI